MTERCPGLRPMALANSARLNTGIARKKAEDEGAQNSGVLQQFVKFGESGRKITTFSELGKPDLTVKKKASLITVPSPLREIWAAAGTAKVTIYAGS